MSRPEIVILGAGGAALELAEALVHSGRAGMPLRVLGFLDDDPQAVGLPELGLGGRLGALGDAQRLAQAPQVRFMLGIVSHRNMRRREAIAQGLGLPAERFHTFVHPGAMVSATATLGPGAAVMARCMVGPHARIGEHVWLSMGSCCGHDASVGACAVVAPNATLSGRVRIGAGAYIGAASAIAPDVTVGERALVGIGAVVDAVADGAMVFGNPARVVQRRQAGRAVR